MKISQNSPKEKDAIVPQKIDSALKIRHKKEIEVCKIKFPTATQWQQ